MTELSGPPSAEIPSGGREPPASFAGLQGLLAAGAARKLPGVERVATPLASRPPPGEPPVEWQSIRFEPNERLRGQEDWRVRDNVHVAGLHQHREAVNRFFYAAWQKCLADPAVELVRQPLHGYDPNYIAVFGFYYELQPRRFRKPERIVHRLALGHIPAPVAAVLAPAERIAAELRECAWLPGEPEAKTVELTLLVPRETKRNVEEF